MSYIFNRESTVSFADNASIDAFGRLRTSNITGVLDIKHNFDKNPLIVSEATGGTCSSVFNEEFARVRMSVSGNGYVVRQSKNHATYQPGKSQLFEASFSNFHLETDVIKRVGIFESTTAATFDNRFDGLFLESNGVTNKISFNIYRSGTFVYSSDTTNWASDEIDPSTLDWTKTQLMVADYQWLGVGRVRFGMSLSGKTIYFTEHNNTNDDEFVYMSSPNQPIRYEIRSSGGTGLFDMLCSQVSTEGPINQGLYYSTSIPHLEETTLALANTKYAYIGYRLNPSFKHSSSKLTDTIIICTSNDNHSITVEYNPIISGTPVWTNLTNTPLQYSLGTGGTEVVTTSGFVIGSSIGKAGATTQVQLNVQDSIIQPGSSVDGTCDEVWICLQSLGGTQAKFRGTANIIYYP